MAESSPFPATERTQTPSGADTEAVVAAYEPSAADAVKVNLVEDAFLRGKQLRQPHEPQWFVNHAFDRGNHYVVWADGRGLVVPPAPNHRVRLTVNLIAPLNKARASKFLRSRPVPICIPATSDVTDRQNARFTTKALEYQTRRLRLEAQYGDAVRIAQLMGHGYWWLYWDETLPAKVKVQDPLTGEAGIEEIQGGDVVLEVDSPWSLLVGDPAIHFIGNQPWIVRIKQRPLELIKARYPARGKFVAGEFTTDDALRFEEQVATLNAQGVGGLGLSTTREASKEGVAVKTHALVKEYFERPCPKYPKGRYLVAAGGVLLKESESLPYGFSDLANPYPVVDFPDVPRIGQYWITTICEQLISPQREYNLLRSKLAEHLRLQVHPKIFVAKQHLIPPGAWTAEAGEVIEYVAVPHLPPPTPWHPPPIAADVWKALELIRKEMADIAHIYPESEGQVGTASSGFQTNLLQEAVDAVHGPDVEAHGRVLEEAYYKIRRLMKAGYSIDRLLTVAGRDMEPEAFEFGSEQIDDYADIVMISASALPSLPSARSQMILEYWKAGVYGLADDPEAMRQVRSALEMGTADDLYSEGRNDEQQAQVENARFLDGQPLPVPEFYENHERHYRIHTNLLKSPRRWEPEVKRELLAHVLLHVKFQNPQSAIQLAMQYGMPELVADLTGQGPGPMPDTMAPPPPSGMTAPNSGMLAPPPGMSAPMPPPLPPGMTPGGAGPLNPLSPAPAPPAPAAPAPAIPPTGPALMPPGTL